MYGGASGPASPGVDVSPPPFVPEEDDDDEEEEDEDGADPDPEDDGLGSPFRIDVSSALVVPQATRSAPSSTRTAVRMARAITLAPASPLELLL